MKKKIIMTAVVATVVAVVAVWNVNQAAESNAPSDATLTSVEAMAACEITNWKGKVIFSCSGSGSCSETYLGNTITCDGAKN